MKTRVETLSGTAAQMGAVPDNSVDLVVTSPPYPMIEMWDGIFAAQDERIAQAMAVGAGERAFGLMHQILDRVWAEIYRVLKDGGIACVNIGDATRTLEGDFRLYSNHSRILQGLLGLGFVALPDILWRKPTNAPNKFMGSGMLPVGAYVTYEHEYILVVRKGKRRRFVSEAEKGRRRQSAFFWEERNVWFSDVWENLRGTEQKMTPGSGRQRSGAFPFELAYRLVCMFSVQGDRVLDPFLGTGTTLGAALATGRAGVGVEIDPQLLAQARVWLVGAGEAANRFNAERLRRHGEFAVARFGAQEPKYRNNHYGFGVVTGQERELLLYQVEGVHQLEEGIFAVEYGALKEVDL